MKQIGTKVMSIYSLTFVSLCHKTNMNYTFDCQLNSPRPSVQTLLNFFIIIIKITIQIRMFTCDL